MSNEDAQLLFEAFWKEQVNNWPLLKKGAGHLADLLIKDISARGITFRAQHNPARIVSSGAKVDAKSIAERPCFLCPHTLGKEQKGILLFGKYVLLTNPFPILPHHFTIPQLRHIPQLLTEVEFREMAQIAEEYSGILDIYFNGAKAGASAPDHFHFQAGPIGILPLTQQSEKSVIAKLEHGSIALVEESPRRIIQLSSASHAGIVELWKEINGIAERLGFDKDLVNLVMRHTEGAGWKLWIIFRGKHRPECYFKEGSEQMLVSPGVIDMCGIAVLPRPQDYEIMNGELWCQLMEEVSLPLDAFKELIQHIK